MNLKTVVKNLMAAGAAALFLSAAPHAVAATFTVTSTADPGTGGCTIAGSGDGCTLREAINAANSAAGSDSISFASGVTGSVLLSSPLPDITSTLTVQGRSGLVLDAQSAGRIVVVSSGGNLTLQTLKLQNGKVASGGGGAIYNQSGTLILRGCTLSSNAAEIGGAIYNETGTTQLTGCILSNNAAEGLYIPPTGSNPGLGGAIRSAGGTLTLQNCTLRDNKAGLATGSTLSSTRGRGGAISNTDSTIFLQNCTLSGNQALGVQRTVGGTHPRAVFFPGHGGAIANEGDASSVTLTNCTLSENTVSGQRVSTAATYSETTGSGGAIFNASGNFALQNCTFSGNADTTINVDPAIQIGTLVNLGTFSSRNSVFVVNGATPFAGFTKPSSNGDANKNFAFSSTQAAGLDVLKNNGGPVFTMALLPGSPLLNVGLSMGAPSKDARGVSRLQGSGIDVGAFELATLPTLSVNNPRSLNEGNADLPGSVTFDITLSAVSTQSVTVYYQTRDGINNPATADEDYTAKSGKLTFAPGQTLKRVTIFFIGDSKAEAHETFFFDLKTPTNATISDNRGVGTIRNDDATPQLFEDEPSQ